jgi:hypothetical protein
MVPNITRLIANSNIPDSVQTLQFNSNVQACFMAYFPRSLSAPIPRDKPRAASPTKSVLCQCGETSRRSQKPLHELNFIRKQCGGVIWTTGVNMRYINSISRNDGIPSPTDVFHCIYLCHMHQFVFTHRRLLRVSNGYPHPLRGGGCFWHKKAHLLWAPLSVTLLHASVQIPLLIFTCNICVQWTNMQLTNLGFINTFQAILSSGIPTAWSKIIFHKFSKILIKKNSCYMSEA